ncbi:hypothetical protein B4U80_07329 [Leptotrombidium deliense]|uniref:Uncharacterized protein n=1 Tax=Leptotrombidium deliense TaxID=299467 RepID=A0A443SEI7_9ACAR|nr:hypothetical protein B4U80_07329 [Leptotrombidium deliense]
MYLGLFVDETEAKKRSEKAARSTWQSKMSKRSTMLLNKLMTAFDKVVDDDDDERIQMQKLANMLKQRQMELQRRGEGKMFLKCYFNAVACF